MLTCTFNGSLPAWGVFRNHRWFWAVCVCFCSLNLAAQTPGTLDLSFGNNGLSQHHIGTIEHCESMATDADGNIYFGGNVLTFSPVTDQDFLLGKLLPNGQVDSAFGQNGLIRSDFVPGLNSRIIDLQIVDGHLFFMGEANDLARPDTQMTYIGKMDLLGNWDSTFAHNGVYYDPLLSGSVAAGAMEVLANGKILWCGMTLDTISWHLELPLVMRVNPDGSRDSSFGGTGALTWSYARGVVSLTPDRSGIRNRPQSGPENPSKTAVHNDGGRFLSLLVEGDHYLLTGSFFAANYATGLLMRVDTFGTPDTDFGVNGVLQLNLNPGLGSSFWEAVKWQDQYLLTGYMEAFGTDEDFALITVDSIGSQVEMGAADFGGNEDRAEEMLLDPYGHILLAGRSVDGATGTLGSTSDQFALTALTDLTSPVTAFGQQGQFTWSPASGLGAGATAMCLSPDGKILLGGFVNDTTAGNFSDLLFMRLENGMTTGREGRDGFGSFGEGQALVAYPNPVSDVVWVKGSAPGELGELVSAGGVVLRERVDLSGGVEVGELSAGVYFLRSGGGVCAFFKE